MGTRFVTTDECDASAAFKQAYIDAESSDIEIIKSPVGMPAGQFWVILSWKYGKEKAAEKLSFQMHKNMRYFKESVLYNYCSY